MPMACQRGQAVVEWMGLVLLVLVLAGAVTTVADWDGRSMGGVIADRISCTAKGGCDYGHRSLEVAYGVDDAALVRRHLPGLVYESGERQVPVDWRTCRAVACATAGGDRDMDVHSTDRGARVTVFTRLVRAPGRRYIQYWFYYPDSNTAFAGSDRIWTHSPLLQLGGRVVRGTTAYPGFHRDDWEAVAVNVDDAGEVRTRATSHGHWQWCKWSACKDHWGPATGWARVSRGSHAGHLPLSRRLAPQLPGVHLRERTTTPSGVRLVPLETIDRRRYRRLDRNIAPPWDKEAYRRPESPKS
jgi:hypothetical protein